MALAIVSTTGTLFGFVWICFFGMPFLRSSLRLISGIYFSRIDSRVSEIHFQDFTRRRQVGYRISNGFGAGHRRYRVRGEAAFNNSISVEICTLAMSALPLTFIKRGLVSKRLEQTQDVNKVIQSLSEWH
jgi:hypothetical protein